MSTPVDRCPHCDNIAPFVAAEEAGGTIWGTGWTRNEAQADGLHWVQEFDGDDKPDGLEVFRCCPALLNTVDARGGEVPWTMMGRVGRSCRA